MVRSRSSSISTTDGSSTHQRRRSVSVTPVYTARNGLHSHLGSQLSPIPGTPMDAESSPGYSSTPSPISGPGWADPAMENRYFSRSASANTSTSPSGSFFSRHYRKLSRGLPYTRLCEDEKIKTARGPPYHGPWRGRPGRWGGALRSLQYYVRRWRVPLALLVLMVLGWVAWYKTPLHYHYRRSARFGGGEKFVIVVGANVGGGVMEWKGAREWAIERDSLRNKRRYASNWGYNLEIVDMRTKKRYAHEWRESWEKVDHMREAMRKYPQAEWFWWVDLNTLIMEPGVSLQDHIFDRLEAVTYRDINEYNPLKIPHPFTEPWLDEVDRSPVGDGRPESINLLLSQDCSGFNLGSFFLRRSVWTDRLLDLWWDPVLYEQKHMEWAHKEQDALEQLYASQPWIRSHVGFVPQRLINSFPEGACGEKGVDPRFHYSSDDRDFVVNMAGCEWGRDCWGEMYRFRQLSYYLNRNPWERFKEDFVAVLWYKLTGETVKL